MDKITGIASNLYTDAARLIQQADVLLILAGNGMGIDSGLPDFRGDHGFWKAYPPLE
jgi:NAD-dependent SIR2 family protein deacetylase